ncbi:DUF4369 domain-containing protein [Flavobacterium sp. 3HN19-14]|uniref:DUF4369 domain-containing protein n=1 Tax=Flavobacterium sp. 3HN19-14 TaxID=3448133 RepID=UPI003EE02A4F
MTRQFINVDTSKIVDGKFTFKGSAKEPEIRVIDIAGKPEKVLFILENGDIELKINKDSIGLTKPTGTYNNEELNAFKDLSNSFQKKAEKFQKDNMAKMNQARQANDTVTSGALIKQYKALQDEFKKKSEDYIATHPKAFITILLMEGLLQEGDLVKSKKYYDALDKSVKNTKPGIEFKKKLDELQKAATPAPAAAVLKEGDTAPDFSGKTPDGKITSLKQSLGKVTIVDFWASWCWAMQKRKSECCCTLQRFSRERPQHHWRIFRH